MHNKHKLMFRIQPDMWLLRTLRCSGRQCDASPGCWSLCVVYRWICCGVVPTPCWCITVRWPAEVSIVLLKTVFRLTSLTLLQSYSFNDRFRPIISPINLTAVTSHTLIPAVTSASDPSSGSARGKSRLTNKTCSLCSRFMEVDYP